MINTDDWNMHSIPQDCESCMVYGVVWTSLYVPLRAVCVRLYNARLLPSLCVETPQQSIMKARSHEI